MTDLDDLIARLRAATEGTTPEPWIASAEEVYAGPYGALIIADMIYPDTEGNAAFIAAARQLVPEAAAALEALRGGNERLRGVYYELGVRDAAAVVGGREALRQEWQEQLMRRILALLDDPALTPR